MPSGISVAMCRRNTEFLDNALTAHELSQSYYFYTSQSENRTRGCLVRELRSWCQGYRKQASKEDGAKSWRKAGELNVVTKSDRHVFSSLVNEIWQHVEDRFGPLGTLWFSSSSFQILR